MNLFSIVGPDLKSVPLRFRNLLNLFFNFLSYANYIQIMLQCKFNFNVMIIFIILIFINFYQV